MDVTATIWYWTATGMSANASAGTQYIEVAEAERLLGEADNRRRLQAADEMEALRTEVIELRQFKADTLAAAVGAAPGDQVGF